MEQEKLKIVLDDKEVARALAEYTFRKLGVTHATLDSVVIDSDKKEAYITLLPAKNPHNELNDGQET